MTTPLNPDHVEWSRQQFRIIADGGTWAIPRSGLIFTKRGGALVLTSRMPHDPAMPITAAQLREQQDSDYDGTVLHFGAAGIAVTDETTP
jgi:hypothetical protein